MDFTVFSTNSIGILELTKSVITNFDVSLFLKLNQANVYPEISKNYIFYNEILKKCQIQRTFSQ